MQAHTTITPARAYALMASSYNLHFGGTGEAMTPAKAAKLPRGDQAVLCKTLQEKGGSDLYTQADAYVAFVMVVGG